MPPTSEILFSGHYHSIKCFLAKTLSCWSTPPPEKIQMETVCALQEKAWHVCPALTRNATNTTRPMRCLISDNTWLCWKLQTTPKCCWRIRNKQIISLQPNDESSLRGCAVQSRQSHSSFPFSPLFVTSPISLAAFCLRLNRQRPMAWVADVWAKLFMTCVSSMISPGMEDSGWFL